jgi:hypothetical protein
MAATNIYSIPDYTGAGAKNLIVGSKIFLHAPAGQCNGCQRVAMLGIQAVSKPRLKHPIHTHVHENTFNVQRTSSAEKWKKKKNSTTVLSLSREARMTCKTSKCLNYESSEERTKRTFK